MATTTELVLQRVQAVLLGATAAGSRVERGRVDPFSVDELPALNVRRGPTSSQAWAEGKDHVTLSFDVDIEVRGSDWETESDAMHQVIDGLLTRDADLAGAVKGLRCTATAPDAEKGDDVSGRLTVTYECQFIQRRG